MKVFISSLISGMEAERAAVKRAIEMLGHQAIRAEDLGARPSSPQVACLSGLREADAVVLVLGSRYGTRQPSGVSATHEEILEARNRKPLLVFLQAGMEPDADQSELIAEIGGWEGGLFREEFATPEQLGEKVTRAIHQLELARAVAPINPDGMRARALELLSRQERGYGRAGAVLQFAVAVGPSAPVLRPAEIEARDLIDDMEKQALFGQPVIFDRALGVRARIDGDDLILYQGDGRDDSAFVRLSPTGDVLISLPARPSDRGVGLSVVIQEDITERLGAAVSYVSWLLSRIDATERLTHIVPGVRLIGEEYAAWRTRAEHDASPRSIQVPMRNGEQESPVFLAPPHQVRQVLAMDAGRVVEDLVVMLRRRWIS